MYQESSPLNSQHSEATGTVRASGLAGKRGRSEAASHPIACADQMQWPAASPMHAHRASVLTAAALQQHNKAPPLHRTGALRFDATPPAAATQRKVGVLQCPCRIAGVPDPPGHHAVSPRVLLQRICPLGCAGVGAVPLATGRTARPGAPQ